MQRFYYLIDWGDMDRFFTLDYKKHKKVWSMHSISSMSAFDITLLNFGFLARFCPPCMDDIPQFCKKGPMFNHGS